MTALATEAIAILESLHIEAIETADSRLREIVISLADQLEAAKAEVERLQTRPLLQLVKKISAERDNARWADETRRKAVAVIVAERDALRAEVERLRAMATNIETQRSATARQAIACRYCGSPEHEAGDAVCVMDDS